MQMPKLWFNDVLVNQRQGKQGELMAFLSRLGADPALVPTELLGEQQWLDCPTQGLMRVLLTWRP